MWQVAVIVVLVILLVLALLYPVDMKARLNEITGLEKMQFTYYATKLPYVVTDVMRYENGDYRITELMTSGGILARVPINYGMSEANNHFYPVLTPEWLLKWGSDYLPVFELPDKLFHLEKLQNFVNNGANSQSFYFDRNLATVWVNKRVKPQDINQQLLQSNFTR